MRAKIKNSSCSASAINYESVNAKFFCLHGEKILVKSLIFRTLAAYKIAVKRLKVWSNKAEVEFSVEVEILARVRHKNLLSLRGYCAEGQERLIVADFGFAKFIPDGATHVTTRVKGTLGYLAPEYAMLGKASESCDVYSFGILLLELASGRKPLEKLSATSKRSIAEWALPLACEGKFSEVADPRLNGKYVEEELKRLVLIALVCADNRPEKRPTMLEVLELLDGESKEKLAELENNEVFKNPQSAVCYDDGTPAAEESSDIIKEENDPKPVKETKHENALDG
ncbi:hypothetical protein POUND7_004064 [Theobroma cacao]